MSIPNIPGLGGSTPPTQPRRSETAGTNPSPAPEASRQADRRQVQDVARQLQQIAEPVARNLQFSVDGETGKTVIRVVDSATKEVIRQIPNEEVLAVARAMDRLQGLLLRSKA